MNLLTEENSEHIKCYMIVYALEQELCNLVQRSAITHEDAKKFSKEYPELSLQNNNEDPKSLIRSCTFRNILYLTKDFLHGTSMHTHLVELVKIVEDLKIIGIRNDFSHATKGSVGSWQWHRCAALACDPVIVSLEFTEVYRSFVAADDGKLESPNKDWIKREERYIPNNLPEHFDHSDTSLYGRQKECKKIENYLLKSRINIVAITAPGGTGKTAVALETLKNLSIKRSSVAKDFIIYITLKQKSLSIGGVTNLNAPDTIDSLKASMLEELNEIFIDDDYESLDDAIKSNQDKDGIICVDNLETLLITNSEEFTDLIEDFPRDWTVLVTSRIPVDNTKTLPLEPLSEKSSFPLSKKYLQTKGSEGDISADSLKKICASSKHNPLAIKLAIDRFLVSGDLKSVQSNVRDDIAKYSFSNLLEVLSDNEGKVLETLFVKNDISFDEISDLLELPFETTVSAVKKLRRTSLIKHLEIDGKEIIRVTESVKDLLRITPITLQTRDLVNKRIKEDKGHKFKHQSQQASRNIDACDQDYIEDSIKAFVHEKLIDAFKALKSYQKTKNYKCIIDCTKELEKLQNSGRKDAVVQITLSRLYFAQSDTSKYEATLEGIESEFQNNKQALNYLLKSWYKLKNYTASLRCANNFIGLNNSSEISDRYILNAWGIRLSSCVFLSLFDEIINLKIDDSNSKDINDSINAYKSMALFKKIKQQIDLKYADSAEVVSIFKEGIDKLSLCSHESVYKENNRIRNYAALDCITQVYYAFKNVNERDAFKDILPYMNKINYVIEELSQVRSLKVEVSYLQSIKIKNNIFDSKKWIDYTKSSISKVDKGQFDDPTNKLVTITRIPRGNSSYSNFIFGKSESGCDYFLHIERSKSIEPYEWARINIGDVLYVPKHTVEADKPALVGEDFVLIN